LNAYDIHTSLTSLHEHNEQRKSGSLIARLEAGDDVAYVSDAGTPGISDPGYRLIRAAITHDIPVVPVPGVSAVITALQRFRASYGPVHFSWISAGQSGQAEAVAGFAG